MTKVKFARKTATFSRNLLRWESSQPFVARVLNATLPLGGFTPDMGFPPARAASLAEDKLGVEVVSVDKMRPTKKQLVY